MRDFIKRLDRAQRRAHDEIVKSGSAGGLSGALSSEGYMGGYWQALADADLVARDCPPNDPRNMWNDDDA